MSAKTNEGIKTMFFNAIAELPVFGEEGDKATLAKELEKENEGENKEESEPRKTENTVNKIVHEQEIPEFRREYHLPSENPINAKVYIIDDNDHSTMLLAEEY